MHDSRLHNWLRTHAQTARVIFSVCTGALLLGAAGLLEGRRATTHWASHELLALYGADAIDARVVIDGNLVTTAGVTAGIDGALAVAAQLFDDDVARGIVNRRRGGRKLQSSHSADPRGAVVTRTNQPAVRALEPNRALRRSSVSGRNRVDRVPSRQSRGDRFQANGAAPNLEASTSCDLPPMMPPPIGGRSSLREWKCRVHRQPLSPRTSCNGRWL